MPEIQTTPRNWSNGAICLVLGLLILTKAPVLGLMSLGIGLTLATTYQGIEFDLQRRRYRNFFWVLGYYGGSWQRLPATSRVVLKPHSDVVIRRSGSMAGNAASERYQHLTLLLSVPGSIIGEVMAEFPLRQRQRAVATGQWIADLLGVPLLILEGA